jgi:hypothetical protein
MKSTLLRDRSAMRTSSPGSLVTLVLRGLNFIYAHLNRISSGTI